MVASIMHPPSSWPACLPPANRRGTDVLQVHRYPQKTPIRLTDFEGQTMTVVDHAPHLRERRNRIVSCDLTVIDRHCALDLVRR